MKIICDPKQAVGQADRMLYSHFLEHFHRQIYGGVYDPSSPIADEDGFRADVIDAALTAFFRNRRPAGRNRHL